jgi:hypothetical protein
MPELEASKPRLEDGHSDSDKARPQTDGFESRVPVMSDGTVAEAVKTPVIASGGVRQAADIRKLKPIGVAGVIVGRSLYEGTLTLKDGLAAGEIAAAIPSISPTSIPPRPYPSPTRRSRGVS